MAKGKAGLPVAAKANLPANWEEQMKADVAASAAAVAGLGGGNWLSVRAGVMKFQGNPLPDSQVEAVVLDWRFENAYYVGDFDPDDPKSPVCYAIVDPRKDPAHAQASMVPFESCEDRQADACKGCPQNEFGTADRGRGKACKNIARLALLHVDYLKDPTTIADAPIVYLKVPVTSLAAWGAYVKKVANVLALPPYGITTKIKAAPDDKVQVRVSFEPAQQLKAKPILAAVFAKRADAAAVLDAEYQSNDDGGNGAAKAKPKAKRKEKAKPAAAAPAKAKAKKAERAPAASSGSGFGKF